MNGRQFNEYIHNHHIKNLEKKFSKLVDRKYSTTVSNGTAALEVAIKALGITKKDEVLIPNFTIISNAIAVLRQQATPVLIDCNLENWNIKIEDIEKKITNKTKAIIITHIYSFPNDMDKILKICKKKKILVIEDAAEVIGSTYNIGGNNELENIELLKKLCEVLDQMMPREESHSNQIKFVSDRPGHDMRYAIDASKIEKELGWKPQETFKTGIKKTVKWYIDNQIWCKKIQDRLN